eukprot:CAMPEP_0194103516 /NCGR_PEP_ID=MMETSP0150-20130528/3946_1 /TAXON_ID=122233 /ORGANISM="Chaetoceros debilis, Strain MM31A-1" /LENGTH=552 /DNA_ID=CAMNT_0038790771 /DNA_START=19 /DNA_END=1677 /DNA_ORIENTATION=+
MAMISRFLNKANRHLRSRKALGFLAIAVGYILIVDVNLQQRSRLLQEQRELYDRELITLDMGAGNCDIGSPTENGNPAGVDTTKTLLVSYPGSGKRFTWTIIKALTNSEVADDWNFSGKLNDEISPLTVKTSWPHREGVWSWGKTMNQVIFLVRDPSRAIPSYHNMRFELDYANDWAESFTSIPMTYKERPAVDVWEVWRDAHFNEEMDNWIKMTEFWMRGGYDNSTESVHSRCENMDIDCSPKAIIDFDHFYQPGANSDFLQLCNVLDDSLHDSVTVSVISSQIRACVLSQVFENPELHQGGRPDAGTEYSFTLSQFDDMLRKVTELRDRVEAAVTDPDTLYEEATALELVVILNKYIKDIAAKRYLSTEIIVEQAAARAFGTATCSDITEGTTDRDSCDYMTNMASHGVLASAYPEESFPYEDYLQERADLVRFYNSNDGTDWAGRDGWLEDGDHCDWQHIGCNEDHRIESILMSNNNINGNFPTDLDNMEYLKSLDLSMNSLSGSVTEALCNKKPDLFLVAMAANCDNKLDPSNPPEYSAVGCCSLVVP